MAPNLDAVQFSGPRLRLARLRAGLTLRELGERTDLTHAAISQFENERSRPSGAVVAKLAIATGVPRRFLFFTQREVSASGQESTHFRSLRSTSKQARGQAWAQSELVLDLAAALDRHVHLPDVNLPALPITADATRRDIAAAADELRAAWSLEDGPVGHLVRHMESHGILVARLPVADRGIDAFSHYQSDRPVVVLGGSKGDAARSRFDAAHELGHLVGHPDADPGGAHEQQANSFAAELLMPEAMITEELPRRFDLHTYARLKHRWGVSIAALLYRAKTLAVISETSYRRSVITMSQRYGRVQEPFPLDDSEQPALLATAINMAADTLESIADEMGLPVDDARTIIGSYRPKPTVQLQPD
jgi:Zn-dependent peptidase ImmA (M78 family)/transcriptional regulator with XRE-family HTH domain